MSGHTKQYGYYSKKKKYTEKPYRYQYKIDSEDKLYIATLIKSIAALNNKPIKELLIDELKEMSNT